MIKHNNMIRKGVQVFNMKLHNVIEYIIMTWILKK